MMIFIILLASLNTLYNGVILGVLLSSDLFFYDNPLESVHNHERAPWFGCACCPGNVTRFMASVPGSVYASGENSVYVNLFTEGEAEIPLGESAVKLKQETRCPWEGTVKIIVKESLAQKYSLMIRIPGWAQNNVVPSDLYAFVTCIIHAFSLMQMRGIGTSRHSCLFQAFRNEASALK